MLDIGISKIIVIGAVALIVIGPERLPSVAKACGILWGRTQKYLNKLKQEVNSHINLEELHNLSQQTITSSQEITQSILANDNTELDVENLVIKRPMNGRYSWRIKQHSMPLWYKRKNLVKSKTQSGSARMKKYRYTKNSKNYFWF